MTVELDPERAAIAARRLERFANVELLVGNWREELRAFKIDPRAIDPDDPEILEDMILAGVNEALRSSRSLMESKMSGLIPGGLGDLGACSSADRPGRAKQFEQAGRDQPRRSGQAGLARRR